MKAKRASSALGLRLDAYLPYLLSITANVASARVASAYAERFNISIPQWRVIAVLAEAEAASQGEVCRRTAMDKVTVSRAVATLVSRGLVEANASRDDARARRLSLTRDGLALYREIAPLALQIEATLTADLSAEELALLTRLLARVRDAADEDAR